jgi:hypothetical protein
VVREYTVNNVDVFVVVKVYDEIDFVVVDLVLEDDEDDVLGMVENGHVDFRD